MTLMGLVSSYEGLVVARFFLGVAECGFFPGAVYVRLPPSCRLGTFVQQCFPHTFTDRLSF